MPAVITTTFYLLTIFVPLTFTTINYELFEFPKFILLFSGSLTILVSWAIHLYTEKISLKSLWQQIWHDHPRLKLVTLGILLVLLTQTLATIFSIHPYTSWWGYYSRYHQGLLTTLCYSLIYFASLTFLTRDSVHKLLKLSLGTAILISLYALAQRLGIDKSLWIQDVVNRPFSTLGQPNWLAAYLLPNIFLLIYLKVSNTLKSNLNYHLLLAILLAGLFVTKSRSGFIAFGLAYLAYWVLTLRNFSWPKLKNIFTSSLIVLFVVAATTGTAYSPPLYQVAQPPTPAPTVPAAGGTVLENGGITESGDIRKIVWTGALRLLQDRPLLGTGVETFAYSYYWQRPVEHNYTSEWDFLYNKAHNEYLNFAATTGLLGLGAYLFFHLAVGLLSLTKVKKTKKANHQLEDQRRALYPVLAATLISFTITNFFGFSVIPVYLMTILVITLPSALNNSTNHQPPTSSLLLTSLLFSALLILLLPLRLFFADLQLAEGKAYLAADRLDTARAKLEASVNLRPKEALTHSYLAETYAQMAATVASQESETALAEASDLTQLALNEINLNREQNPWHLNFYKSRTKAYLSLALLDSDTYHQLAAKELERSRELAPTDPKLAYNLGLVYSRLDQLELSIKQMEDSIALKSNYYEPYYALALLYETSGQTDKLISLLMQAQANFDPLPTPLADKVSEYFP